MFKLIYKWTDKIKEKVAAISKKMNEKGQGLTEYALILAAIAVIAVAAVYGVGSTDGGLKKQITTSFTNATNDIKDANEANHSTTNGGNN